MCLNLLQKHDCHDDALSIILILWERVQYFQLFNFSEEDVQTAFMDFSHFCHYYSETLRFTLEMYGGCQFWAPFIPPSRYDPPAGISGIVIIPKSIFQFDRLLHLAMDIPRSYNELTERFIKELQENAQGRKQKGSKNTSEQV